MNIAEFARKIGVSTAAVSYAINGKAGHLSSATRAMILTRMEELGYHPSRLAVAFATQQTRIIALWTKHIYPAYYTHTIHHLRQLLKAEGFEFHIVEPPAFAQSFTSPSWPVDGIIAFHKNPELQSMLDSGANQGIPIVNMGADHLVSIDHVRMNTYDASVEAVGHLIRSGRRRIAYLLSGRAGAQEAERPQAYSAVMREAGLETEFIQFDSQLDITDRASACQRIKECIGEANRLDAIIGADDEAAIGAYKALRDLGIRIPADIALMGCDGIDDTKYFDPALTTIVLPIQQMCEIAWGFLKNRMADPEIPLQHQVLNARLAIRGSSDPQKR